MPETTATTKARRRTAATDRSTPAKKAAATRARNRAAEAARRTAAAEKAAEARRGVARTPVERYVDYAGRAVTIPVGAALVARDTAVATVGDLANRVSSLDAIEREIRARRRRVEDDLRRFERRGASARDDFERDLRERRMRVTQDLRAARRDVGAQAGLVGARVENVLQSSITTGAHVAARVTERVARAA